VLTQHLAIVFDDEDPRGKHGQANFGSGFDFNAASSVREGDVVASHRDLLIEQVSRLVAPRSSPSLAPAHPT